MDRDVGGVRHQAPVGSKERAGEIQPLLNVGGDGRALQDAAHLLCGGEEEGLLSRSPDGVNAQGSALFPQQPARSMLTCDTHEAMGEDGELDGVHLEARGTFSPRSHGDADVAKMGHRCCAARFD